MRNASKALLLSLFTLSLFAVCQAPSALAQSRDLKLISARAGAVNFTSGAVEFKRKTGTRWEALTNTHDLRSGDTARTGADGRFGLRAIADTTGEVIGDLFVRRDSTSAPTRLFTGLRLSVCDDDSVHFSGRFRIP